MAPMYIRATTMPSAFEAGSVGEVEYKRGQRDFSAEMLKITH